MSALGGALGDARGTISVDTGPAGKGLDQLGKKLQGLDRTSRGFGSGFDQALGDIGSSANRAAGRIRGIFSGLNLNVSPSISVDTGPASRAIGIVEGEFRNLNSAGLQIDDGFNTAASQMVATAEQTAGRIRGSLGGALSTGLGFIGAQVATSVVNGFGNAVGNALDYSGALANVNSIAQLTTPELAALNQQVLDLANDPRVLDTPTELAGGLYDIYSSGFQGAEGLQVLEAASIAATAGLTTTGTSGRAISAVLNAYGLDASHAADVSDYLFQTVNSGVITFDELANNMGSVLPIASQLNVGIDQVGAAYASLTLQGISATEAETGVANILRSALNPTDELTAAVQAHGYASAEAALQAEGLGGFLTILEDASGGTAEGMNSLLGSTEATNAAMALTNDTGKGYNDMLGDMEGATEGAGATQEALAKQMESASFKVEKAKQALSTMATTVLGLFMPVIGAAADLVTKFAVRAQGLVDVLGKGLKPVAGFARRGLGVLGGVVGALLSPVTKAVDRFKGFYDTLRRGTTVMRTTTDAWDNTVQVAVRLNNGLGIVNSALGALALAFPSLAGPIATVQRGLVSLTGKWTELTDRFREANKWTDPVSAALGALGQTFPTLSGMTQILARGIGNLTAAFSGPDGFIGGLKQLPTLIGDAIGGMGALAVEFKNWTLNVAAPNVIAFVGDLIAPAKKAIEEYLGIGSAGQVANANRGQSFAPITWKDWLLNIGPASIHWAWDALSAIYAWIKRSLGVGGVANVIGAEIVGKDSGELTQWSGWALGIGQATISWAWDALSGIRNWIEGKLGVGMAKSASGGTGKGIDGEAVTWSGWALGIGKASITWAWDAITGIYSWIKNSLGIGGGAGAIGAEMTGKGDSEAVEWGGWALSILGPAISWAWEGISAIYTWIKGALGVEGGGSAGLKANTNIGGQSDAVEWGNWALSIGGPASMAWDATWGGVTDIYDWIRKQLGIGGTQSATANPLSAVGASATGSAPLSFTGWVLEVGIPKLVAVGDFIDKVAYGVLGWVRDALESIDQDDLSDAMWSVGSAIRGAFSGSMEGGGVVEKGGSDTLSQTIIDIVTLALKTAGNAIGPLFTSLVFGDSFASLDEFNATLSIKIGDMIAAITEPFFALQQLIGDDAFNILFGFTLNDGDMDDLSDLIDRLHGVSDAGIAAKNAMQGGIDAVMQHILENGDLVPDDLNDQFQDPDADNRPADPRIYVPKGSLSNATAAGDPALPNNGLPVPVPDYSWNHPQDTNVPALAPPPPPPPPRTVFKTPTGALLGGDPNAGQYPDHTATDFRHTLEPQIVPPSGGMDTGNKVAASGLAGVVAAMTADRARISEIAGSVARVMVPPPQTSAFQKGAGELPGFVSRAASRVAGMPSGTIKAPQTNAFQKGISDLPKSVSDLAGRVGGIATGSVKAPQTTGFTSAVKGLPTSVTTLAQTITGTKMGSIQKPETTGFASAIDGLKRNLTSLSETARSAGAAAFAALAGAGNGPVPQKAGPAAPAAQPATPNFAPAIAAANAAKTAIGAANTVIQTGATTTSAAVIGALTRIPTSGLPPVTQLATTAQQQFATMNTVNSVAVRTLQSAVGTSFGTIQTDGGAKVTGLNATVVGQFAAMQGGASGAASGMEGSVGGSMTGMQGKSVGAASATNSGVVGQLNTMAGGGGTAAGRLVSSVVGTLQGGAGAASSAGYSLGAAGSQGVAAGMNAYLGAIQAAVNNIVSTVARGLAAGLQVRSPSRLTGYYGTMATQGVATFMEKAIPTVTSAVGKVIGAVESGLGSSTLSNLGQLLRDASLKIKFYNGDNTPKPLVDIALQIDRLVASGSATVDQLRDLINGLKGFNGGQTPGPIAAVAQMLEQAIGGTASAVGDAVSESNSEWAAVLGPNGEVAYAFKKYLKEITGADGKKQYVVADTQIGLNLRDAASLSGKILTAVSDGTVLGWRQVAGSSDGSGSGTGTSADDEAKAEADRQFKAWQTLQAALTAEGKRLSTLLTTQYGLQAVMNRRLGDPIDRIVERLGQIAYATGTTLNDKFALIGARIVEGIKNMPTPSPGASTPSGGQQQTPPPYREPGGNAPGGPTTLTQAERDRLAALTASRPARVPPTSPAVVPSAVATSSYEDRPMRVQTATTPMVATTNVQSTTYVTIDTRSADAMQRIEALLDDVPTASVRVRGSVTRPPRNGR